MATTPMNHVVKITWDEYAKHPLRKEWNSIPNGHPTYGDGKSLTLFLKQEYNINISYIEYDYDNTFDIVLIEFHSAQDYILWQLHQ